MSIKQSIRVILAGSVLLTMACVLGVSLWVFFPKIREVENQYARNEMKSTLELIDAELKRLQSTARDYSTWDDMYEFAQSLSPEFIKANFPNDSLKSLNIQAVLLIRPDGSIAYLKYLDGEGNERPAPEDMKRLFGANGALAHGKTGLLGVLPLGGKPYLAAGTPVLTSTGRGPSRGTFVFLRAVGADFFGDDWMVRHARMNFTRRPWRGKAGGQTSDTVILGAADNGNLAIEAQYADLTGKTPLSISFELPRLFYTEMKIAGLFFLLCILLFMLFSGLMLQGLLNKFVLRRLEGLSDFVGRLETCRDFSCRTDESGHDELARLARQFNALLARIQEDNALNEKAREDLLKSEQRFRAVFETAPIGICVWNLEKKTLVDCNAAFEQQSGYSKAALNGKSPSDLGLTTPEASARMREQLESEGRILNTFVEFTHPRLGPQISLLSVVLIDWAGEKCALTSSMDVTQISRVEEALRQSEEQLRTLINAMPDVVCFKDGEGRWIEANDFVQRLFQMQDMEWRGATDRELGEHSVFFKDVMAGLCQYDNVAWTSGSIARMDVAIPQPGGEELIFDTLLIPAFNNDGSRRGLVVVGRDVTQRKQAEQAARESEELFHTIFSLSPLALMICRAEDSVVLDANDAFVRMFGFARNAVLGKRIPDLNIWPDLDKRAEYITQVLEQKAFDGREVKLRNADGQLLTMLLAGGHLRLGGVPCFLHAAMDITSHKQTELQLRQAQKMEAIGQLAGGVAHDFNNLLQIILGFGELLKRDLNGSPRQLSMLGDILKAGEKAQHLTRQLLAFSRKQSIEMRPVDLNEIIADLLKMLRRLIGEHIKLSVQSGPELAFIQADRGQIEQIIINLCVNARDAMPEGGTLTIETVNVTLEESDCAADKNLKAGPHVRLIIADEGGGIAPEHITRIFEPFFTTKEAGKGTGLGLATVYGIAHQHGGTVQVDSELGRGAVFSVLFPALLAEKQPCGAEEDAPVKGGNETVLLAEDDEMVRELTSHILRQAGYTVLAACDGQDAVLLYDQHFAEIKLLVFDMIMPRMNGGVAAEAIRTHNPALPCLFCTGYNDMALRVDEINGGTAQLIRKPYNARELLKKARELLDGAAARAGARGPA